MGLFVAPQLTLIRAQCLPLLLNNLYGSGGSITDEKAKY